MYTVSINSTKRREKQSVSKRAMARIIRSSWSAFTIYYGCFRRNQLGRRSNQFLDVESHGIMGSYIPHRHRLRWLGDMARGILLTGCDPGMLGCLVWQI